MHKFQLVSESVDTDMVHPWRMARRHALTGITVTRRMPALRMDITGRSGSPTASLSVPAPGIGPTIVAIIRGPTAMAMDAPTLAVLTSAVDMSADTAVVATGAEAAGSAAAIVNGRS